jgi:hypothetical protein
LLLKVELGEAPADIPASVDVRLGAAEAAATIDGGPIDRILNRFAGRVRVTRVFTSRAALSRPGARHREYDDLEHVIGFSRTFRVDAERACCIHDLVDALRQLTHVQEACPYYLCSLPFKKTESVLLESDDGWPARDQIRARRAMEFEAGDPAVIVAVLDTGVRAAHPELRGRLRPGYDTVEIGPRDLASGLQLLGDLTESDDNPDDQHVGHGNSCAAIIGARGERIPPGLAGRCGLLPMRVLGAAQMTGKSEAVGIGALPDIDAGVKRAIDLGATVLNMSFGTPESALDEGDPVPHADVCRYGAARGCIMVAASGNTGQEERFAPACLEEVIAVGSVDSEGKVSRFTTRGEHVALCAPGERVLSAGLESYQMVTGTSFAAPFVAATVALLVSHARHHSQPANAATIREVICQSAQPWAKGEGAGGGAGILNAHASLQALDQLFSSDLSGSGQLRKQKPGSAVHLTGPPT